MTFPQEMELIHNIWRGQIPLWKSFPYQKISETTYKRILSLKKITFHSNFKENQAEPSRAESSRAESSWAESSWAESSQVEPSQPNLSSHFQNAWTASSGTNKPNLSDKPKIGLKILTKNSIVKISKTVFPKIWPAIVIFWSYTAHVIDSHIFFD